MRRKLLSLCLSLALCVSLVPAASAAPTPSYPSAQALAGSLKALGLFLGDESGNFDLDRAPTRIEALIMLIRALGEEPKAKAAGKAHPFTDVPTWADGYVSWGYAKGYTKGVSADQFGAENPADSRMYLTFLLRALGYTEGEGGDFTYAQPFYLAYQAKILPFAADYVHFTRADAVMTTAAALWADLAGSDKALADRLMEQGRFTVADFSAQFPQDPFSWEHSLMPLVDKALSDANPTGQTDRKTIQAQAHVITYAVYKPDLDQTRVYAMVGHASREWNAEGGEQSGGSGAGFWTIDFATKTGQVLACEHGGDFSDWPVTTEGHNAYADLFTPTLRDAAMAKLNALEASGDVGYQPPTYDQAVAELRAGFERYNIRTLDTDECTIFVYDVGGMHRQYERMTVIYKPGSALGDGHTITLPHARLQYMVYAYPTDAMALSEDGRTFTYTYYRPEDIVGWMEGVNEGEVLEKAGQITYTVDLPTGEVTETFTPPNYDAAMAHVTRKRVISNSEHSEDREVVQTLESDQCTVVLTKGRFMDRYDDYILSLVYKPGSALGDGTIKQLILPSTVYDKGFSWYKPTDRSPDSLTLSEDGKALTYAYHFDDRLAYTAFVSASEQDEFVLHEAGTYTYTVDLSTGELSAVHTAE